MSENNIYTAPKAELIDKPEEENPEFFPTSTKKLIILYIATLGIYPVYWFYKQWKYQQKVMDKKIIPILRSIFLVFFTHSLFRNIEAAAEKKNIAVSWGANALASVFIILIILSNVLDNFNRHSETITALDYISLLLLFPIAIPLYMVQLTINKINNDPQGKLNSRFSIYNYIFILLGVLWWLLILVGFQVIDLEAVLSSMDNV